MANKTQGAVRGPRVRGGGERVVNTVTRTMTIRRDLDARAVLEAQREKTSYSALVNRALQMLFGDAQAVG